MNLTSVTFYLIVIVFAVTFLRNLIYIFFGPFYALNKRRMIKSSQKYTREEIEKKIKISVIVPAWNEEVGILSSIKSLLLSNYNNLELILVDDGSTDNTRNIVNNFVDSELGKYVASGKEFKFFSKKNGGKGSALNYGIKESTGNLIITMDADTVFDKDAVLTVAKYFVDSNLDAAVGNVKVGNPNSFLGIIQQIEYLLGFFFKRTHAIFNGEYIISGAFGIFRRETFDKYGYFDEVNKTEDIEFSTRLQSKGCKITFIEDAIAYTETPSSLIDLMKQRLRWKKGRLDAFYTHRTLFFSGKKKHNKFLTFYLLPLALFYELELIVEPLLLLFVTAYFFQTGDVKIFFFWGVYVAVTHAAAFIFGKNKNRARVFAFLPAYLFLSYILVLVEVYAIYACIKLILAKKDVQWQVWKRKGLSFGYGSS